MRLALMLREDRRSNMAWKKTHQRTRTPIHRTWTGMITRCKYPCVNGFKNYGGRGIKVCDRWLGPNGLQNFVDDMGERPSLNHSIDRINPNGDYEPGNCKWSTLREQAQNRRTNVKLTYRGKTLHIAGWSRVLGIKTSTIHMRLYRGWSVEKTLGYLYNSDYPDKRLSRPSEHAGRLDAARILENKQEKHENNVIRGD